MTGDGGGAAPIAITGIGILGPFGSDRESFWTALTSGATGLRPAGDPHRSAFGDLPVARVDLAAGEPQVTGDGWSLARAGHMAVVAAREAIDASGGLDGAVDRSRVGVVYGSCMGGTRTRLDDDGSEDGRLISPVGHSMQSLADAVAASIGVTGPRLVVNTACAAGATAIGVAVESLRAGRIDLALAGGAEELSPLALAGFLAVAAVDREVCSPYGRSRGLNMGEGAAFLVLERLDEARRRGARVDAVLLGYGLSADAHHPTQPDPAGIGAELAIRRAVSNAGIELDEIDYVNGHGTATPANDAMELRLFGRLFGGRGEPVLVGSTKGATGHAFAATAAMEVACAALSVARDEVPPTLGNVGEAAGLRLPTARTESQVDVALSTSYAFGGNNASVIVGKAGLTRRRPARPLDGPIVISGIGAVGAPGLGRDAWWTSLEKGAPLYGPADVVLPDGTIVRANLADTSELEGDAYASRRQWRRMDDLSRRCAAATFLALEDAAAESFEGTDDTALIIGTESGCIVSAMALEASVRNGERVNPALFANSVMNSTAGHVAGRFGWRGPTATIVSGWVSSLEAILFAVDSIRSRGAGRAVVIGCDLLSPEVLMSLRAGGMVGDAGPSDGVPRGSIPFASAAVTFVIEPIDDALERGAEPLAEVRNGASVGSATLCTSLPFDERPWGMAVRRAAEPDAPASVDVVVSAANGVEPADRAEAAALAAVGLGGSPRLAPKLWLGESRGAGGAVGVLAACHVFASGRIPPDPSAPGGRPTSPPDLRLDSVGRVLVNAATPGGTCSSLVLDRVGD